MEASKMHQPLEGIRVLEWGLFHAGPGATAILADMGAEVIKIEQPGMGDYVRKAVGYKDINFNLRDGVNLFNLGSNRNKKSITIDLTKEEGRQIVYNLATISDVFFTNIRRKSLIKNKMEYHDLAKVNPTIIYASVTGFGKKGPGKDAGAFDYQGQGMSGMMYAFGEPQMTPVLGQFGIIDQATAIMASYQIVAALFMRARLGVGQEVDVSILGTASYLLYFNNLVASVLGRNMPRHGQIGADPLRNYYCCQDGKWLIQTQAPGEDRWKKECSLIGHPELAENPRYDTREKRMKYSEELVAIFNKAFLTKPRDEWLQLLHEADLIGAPVNTSVEAVHDPHLLENEYIKDFDHPELGRIGIPIFPIHFSEAEVRKDLIAPKLGEHTDEVLRQLGGYSDEEIIRLKENKVL